MSKEHITDDNSIKISPHKDASSRPLQDKENSSLPAPDNKDQLSTKNTSNHVPSLHKNGKQVHYSKRKGKGKAVPKSHRTKMQELLAMCAVVLDFLLLGSYVITREPALLGFGTVFAAVILIVYRYYFYRRR